MGRAMLRVHVADLESGGNPWLALERPLPTTALVFGYSLQASLPNSKDPPPDPANAIYQVQRHNPLTAPWYVIEADAQPYATSPLMSVLPRTSATSMLFVNGDSVAYD